MRVCCLTEAIQGCLWARVVQSPSAHALRLQAHSKPQGLAEQEKGADQTWMVAALQVRWLGEAETKQGHVQLQEREQLLAVDRGGRGYGGSWEGSQKAQAHAHHHARLFRWRRFPKAARVQGG